MLGFISACRDKYIIINWFFQVLATSLLERYNSTSDEFVFHQDSGLSPGLLLFAYRWSVGRMEKHSSIPARNMLMSFAALHWHFQPHLQSASMRTRKSIWLNLSLARLNTSWEKRKTTVWESSFVTVPRICLYCYSLQTPVLNLTFGFNIISKATSSSCPLMVFLQWVRVYKRKRKE